MSYPRVWATFLLAGLAAAQQTPLEIPAFTAYAHPDPDAMRRDDDGSVRRWRGTLSWYGHFAKPGELRVTVRLSDVREAGGFRLACSPTSGGPERTTVTARFAAGARELVFPPLTIAAAGYQRLELGTDDAQRPALVALLLEGEAALGARFCRLERRNAASVHLGWQVERADREDVEWFYCELTPRDDPLWTYYMATGWHRGYFGMQVNGPRERRLIFSVWDAGDEAIDRSKVAEADRVQLVAKGDGVVAEGFGNEGTGGHSHLVHPWRLGETFRFALHARVDGDRTVYSGWFYFAERKEWGLIASFSAPKDGRLPHGLYSFVENFAGQNGDLRRRCEFGNAWIRTSGGAWRALRSARFTHDGHGESERLDRSAGVSGARLYLAQGGFVDDREPGAVTEHGGLLRLEGDAGAPPSDLPQPISRR
ncbi:MAG: DUF3472 domain-containing protein [Planctomycetes bacterium]|nr:DUF3472 domain-containing protein [Planctomycetota bacterium]